METKEIDRNQFWTFALLIFIGLGLFTVIAFSSTTKESYFDGNCIVFSNINGQIEITLKENGKYKFEFTSEEIDGKSQESLPKDFDYLKIGDKDISFSKYKASSCRYCLKITYSNNSDGSELTELHSF